MDYKQRLAAVISDAAKIDAINIAGMIEIPPGPDMGDFALPCFKLSAHLKKAPPAIAADLHNRIVLPDFISEATVLGGYLNFYLKKETFIRDTITEIEQAGPAYGSAALGAGKTVCIDYSSINIAKPFHIGHLSTTAIGNSLYRIYKFLGYKCVGINHLGDWGTQFGKLIYAYKTWGNKKEIEAHAINAMLKLYVRFHDEAEKDPSLDERAREWFKKIEDGDSEAMEIFNRFKELTLKEVQKIYDLLGVQFDSYDGESFYNDKMQPVIDELKQKGLLELSSGAYVVRLDGADLPPCIILKSDGATLYSTRDLAAAFYRKKTYNFDKCLYVVAYQQNLHFRQLFEVLHLMGYSWAKDMEHVAFGMVSLEDGTLSTRKGKVVFLEDVLEKAVEKTLETINEKNPELNNKQEVAKQVGIGAVVFNVLSNGRIKDITFSWDRVLNFDGETGPYVQYTHARCNSLLERAGIDPIAAEADFGGLADDEAFEVAKLLQSFPEAVISAAQKNEPSVITRHIIGISKAFNKYYYEHRIIDADERKTAARLKLAGCVKSVVKTGLYLLGINAPDKM